MLTVVSLAACAPAPVPRRVVAEETALRRQIEGIEGLLARAAQGSLVPDGELVVALSEKLIEDTARLALPREQVVAGRYRVRLETIEVRFRDGVGSLRLDGRVSPADRPPEDVFADLAVFGLIDSAELLPNGRMRVQGTPIGFEVARVGVFGETAVGRRLLETLAAEKIDALGGLAFPVEVPVHLEQAVTLEGAGGDGPLRVNPARVPLHVGIARLTAHSRRLWISIAVATASGAGTGTSR